MRARPSLTEQIGGSSRKRVDYRGLNFELTGLFEHARNLGFEIFQAWWQLRSDVFIESAGPEQVVSHVERGNDGNAFGTHDIAAVAHFAHLVIQKPGGLQQCGLLTHRAGNLVIFVEYRDIDRLSMVLSVGTSLGVV